MGLRRTKRRRERGVFKSQLSLSFLIGWLQQIETAPSLPEGSFSGLSKGAEGGPGRVSALTESKEQCDCLWFPH